MLTNAKVYTILSILAIGGLTIFSVYSQKDTSIDSIRVQAQEARQREIEARIDRETTEDTLSLALRTQCDSQALTLTGIRYEEKQRKGYECWREELKKTNTGTVTSAISEVPQGIEPKNLDSGNTGSLSEKSIFVQSVVKKSKTISSSSVISVLHKMIDPQQSSEKSNYWTAYNVAIAQIHKWEGLRLSAYWDHSGYSIGYGSRAKSPTERITKVEADRRLAGLVTQILGKVQKDFPKLRPEAQGALVSFAYNCHSGYRSILGNGLSYHGQWCKTASGKKLTGLVNRRAEESKLIFSKN